MIIGTAVPTNLVGTTPTTAVVPTTLAGTVVPYSVKILQNMCFNRPS